MPDGPGARRPRLWTAQDPGGIDLDLKTGASSLASPGVQDRTREVLSTRSSFSALFLGPWWQRVEMMGADGPPSRRSIDRSAIPVPTFSDPSDWSVAPRWSMDPVLFYLSISKCVKSKIYLIPSIRAAAPFGLPTTQPVSRRAPRMGPPRRRPT
jgi:hypothetical protein